MANQDHQISYKLNENNNNNNSFPLDLNLCYNPNTTDEESNNDDNNIIIPPSNSRVFSCNYCMRKFFSSQALGGHQNAHKRERTIAKRALKIGALADSHVSLASLPLHGSLPSPISSRPSIHIQAHHGSMVMMVHPHLQSSSLQQHHHDQEHQVNDIRGGPGAKFEGQNGYLIGGVPVFNTVPFWPGSFRQVDDEYDDEAESSPIFISNNDHHQFQNQDYCPDLTLKL